MPVTILIVDDHPTFRASARRLLEAEGFEVVGEAGHGHGALEAAAELRPDVVLLDVQLPDIDGFEVARRMSRDGGPAIVLTSSRDWSGVDVRECGAIGFVGKSDLSAAALEALVA